MDREQLPTAVAPVLETTQDNEQPLKEKLPSDWSFFSSGSTLLDLTLGGGWLEGGVSNIIGDKSTGKTLEVVEAFANFKLKHQIKAKMRYAEAEAAFSPGFAATLGFPSEVTKPDKPLATVEEFEADFMRFVRGGGPGLYALDSLDALTAEPEVKKFEKKMKAVLAEKETADDGEEPEKQAGSFGVDKAKEMSKFFRMLTREAEENNVHLMIVSQVRDNVGVMYGEKVTRSGGRALDFYASQITLLAEKAKISKQVYGQPRVIGVTVVCTNKKLKCGMPFRKIEHDILLGYGVDNEISMIRFLTQTQKMAPKDADELKGQIQVARQRQDREFLTKVSDDLKQKTTVIWNKIEDQLAAPMRKY